MGRKPPRLRGCCRSTKSGSQVVSRFGKQYACGGQGSHSGSRMDAHSGISMPEGVREREGFRPRPQ